MLETKSLQGKNVSWITPQMWKVKSYCWRKDGILDMGTRYVWARIDLKASSWGLTFWVLEITRKASKGGKKPIILSTYDMYEPQK